MAEQKKPRVLAVAGPTGSGKSALAVELCLEFRGEVISADALQVYRGLDIATAKITGAEMRGVPHHLIDIRGPGEPYSVADYVRDAAATIGDITARGLLPVLCGGTGLYLSSLLSGTRFTAVGGESALRQRLRERLEREGPAALHTELRALDPEAAEKIHPNNAVRVLRALEIVSQAEAPLSKVQRAALPAERPYRALVIGLCFRDRGALYRRIDARVDDMVRRGLIEEARALFERGALGRTAGGAIGYKELFAAFRGDCTEAEAIALIKQRSRNYAKRQETWFRRERDIHWIEIDGLAPREIFARATQAVAGSGLFSNR